MKCWSRIAWVLLSLNAATGQGTGVRSQFDAASIKVMEGGRSGLGSLRGGPGTSSPGRLTGAATLKLLLMRAYDLREFQIAGPGWIESARYEIQARLPDGADAAQLRVMLRSLLAERFGLEAHRETRQLAAYELTPAKGGPKLTPSTKSEVREDRADTPTSPKFVKGADGLPELRPGGDVPRTYAVVLGRPDGLLYKVWGRRETMAELADRLYAQLGRPVIDATGLKGEYDFTLSWAVESAGGVVPRNGPPPDEIEMGSAPVLPGFGITIFAAVEKQLGLRLEEKRLPVELLVVDRANAKPTEN